MFGRMVVLTSLFLLLSAGCSVVKPKTEVRVVLPPEPEVIEIPVWDIRGTYRDLVAYAIKLQAAAKECRGYQEDLLKWMEEMRRKQGQENEAERLP